VLEKNETNKLNKYRETQKHIKNKALDKSKIIFNIHNSYIVHTVHLMSLKLYIITPPHAQVTNKSIVVKDIRYNPTLDIVLCR
jgi:hypothetical protein